MRVDLFDFELPAERIALRPKLPRDASKLLVVKPGAALADRFVRDLPELLRAGDALVVNDTRVIPAELHGERVRDGATAGVSVTLIKRIDGSRWQALARGAKKLNPGDRVRFGQITDAACLIAGLDATVEAKGEAGEVTLAFDVTGPVLDEAIAAIGHVPLPPYIASRRTPDNLDRRDYQTVFAQAEGAVAAPTAGLHFTEALFARLAETGVTRHTLTLHVGAGTFLPVKADDTADHRMHAEWGTSFRRDGRRIERDAGGGRTDCGRRHDDAAPAGVGDRRRRHDPAVRRRDVDLHHAGLPLSRRRSADDEFPPAALDAVHAGLRVRRARDDAGGVCPRDREEYRFYSYGDACLLWPEGGR